MKRAFLKSQHYTFNTTRTKLCHKYIHMLSVCGSAYFYSRKNMRFYAERLTIQKITFVDEKIWNSSLPSSPLLPFFCASSLSLFLLAWFYCCITPDRDLPSVLHSRLISPSIVMLLIFRQLSAKKTDRHNHRACATATTNTALMTTNTNHKHMLTNTTQTVLSQCSWEMGGQT